MSLDKPTLQAALEVAFGRDQVVDSTSKANIVSMAAQVATAIDTFVKSGTVNTVVTIPSTASAGSPSAGTGVGTVT